MPVRPPQKPLSQADVRLATQLLGFLPWIGRLTSAALRDAGGGSIARYKVLGMLSGKGPIGPASSRRSARTRRQR